MFVNRNFQLLSFGEEAEEDEREVTEVAQVNKTLVTCCERLVWLFVVLTQVNKTLVTCCERFVWLFVV